MTITSPKVTDWQGLKPPVIVTVKSLQRSIPPDRYSQVYWIKTIGPVDHVVTECHPLKSWYFAADGRLLGGVDTGTWSQIVDIALDDYVVLSLK